MRRLNETELDARIHNFLERKFAEFPELDPETDFKAAKPSQSTRRAAPKQFQPRIRWGTAL